MRCFTLTTFNWQVRSIKCIKVKSEILFRTRVMLSCFACMKSWVQPPVPHTQKQFYSDTNLISWSLIPSVTSKDKEILYWYYDDNKQVHKDKMRKYWNTQSNLFYQNFKDRLRSDFFFFKDIDLPYQYGSLIIDLLKFLLYLEN
jgi:hypothetical protein